MEFNIPLYAGIHKGQRRWLAEMIVRAGRTDFTQRAEVEWLMNQLDLFLAHHREHAELEQRFVHPRLSLIVPGGARAIEEEHEEHHEMLKDMIHSLDRIKGIPPDHPTLPLIGQDFYLALNRFVASYLMHIDYEESYVQNVLLNDSTAEEIMDIFQQILAAQPATSLRDNLTLMLAAMNVPEAVGLLTMAKGKLPQALYDDLTARAAQFIGPQRWTEIQAALGNH
ncbi:MAG: hypothetical protein A4E32_01654 [Methanomassiliicoccales archaeon PtaU1.Bin124]|nr:MAG: hypothetical protein A4E32_01654 [Methanomassiliicoccales archaeon PtaU1.Bin124]